MKECRKSLTECGGSLKECRKSLMECGGSLTECGGSLMECGGSLMECLMESRDLSYFQENDELLGAHSTPNMYMHTSCMCTKLTSIVQNWTLARSLTLAHWNPRWSR